MSYRTVKIKGDGIMLEGVASGAVTPGMLVERVAGVVDDFRAHAGAAGYGQRMFAFEDENQGKGITDDYADNDRIFVLVMAPGDMVNAIIEDGENIAVNDFLESAGNGKLQKFTSGVRIAQAREACDMSGSSAEDPTGRCAVEIVA